MHWRQVLGVPEGAGKKSVEAAFRRLALQHHPNKAPATNNAFKALHAAYTQAMQTFKKRKRSPPSQQSPSRQSPGPARRSKVALLNLGPNVLAEVARHMSATNRTRLAASCRGLRNTAKNRGWMPGPCSPYITRSALNARNSSRLARLAQLETAFLTLFRYGDMTHGDYLHLSKYDPEYDLKSHLKQFAEVKQFLKRHPVPQGVKAILNVPLLRYYRDPVNVSNANAGIANASKALKRTYKAAARMNDEPVNLFFDFLSLEFRYDLPGKTSLGLYVDEDRERLQLFFNTPNVSITNDFDIYIDQNKPLTPTRVTNALRDTLDFFLALQRALDSWSRRALHQRSNLSQNTPFTRRFSTIRYTILSPSIKPLFKRMLRDFAPRIRYKD